MLGNLWIYVAGPYSKPDPIQNTHNTLQIADKILKLGGTPIIPHLSLLWHLYSPKEYVFWLEYNMEFLRKCQAVFRIQGESYGANEEEKVAHEIGIPIFYNLYDLTRWINGTTTL